MTDEQWQPPTEPWSPDETQTQWVRSEPARGSVAWSPDADESAAPQWGDRQQTSPRTRPTPEGGANAPSPVVESERGGAVRSLAGVRQAAQVACPLLLLAGLSFDELDTDGWHTATAWALFAVVCAILQLGPLAGRRVRLSDESSWFLCAVGTAGLVAYWVIIVLPGASTNAGFVQTLAVGLAGVGLWMSPGRRG